MTMIIKESKELLCELVNLLAMNGKIKNEIASPVRVQLAKKVLKSYADQLNPDNLEPDMAIVDEVQDISLFFQEENEGQSSRNFVSDDVNVEQIERRPTRDKRQPSYLDDYEVGIDGDIVANVYAPQNPIEKKKLWDNLKIIRRNTQGHWLCFGDYNAIWDESDVKGKHFNPRVSQEFNQFILDSELIEVPLRAIKDWFKMLKESLEYEKSNLVKQLEDLDDKVDYGLLSESRLNRKKDFIKDVMMRMGFGTLWRNWIRACLDFGFSSVLVNGSPTLEFKLSKGLRQGDPLSPFFFITAIKALHIAMLKAKEKKNFQGKDVIIKRKTSSH
uniref:Cysteine-rich receptor-like protein kinase n=1 Tax=Tanacetum cinerariifolium TaxID=118510 RepID=A0A699H8P7_TANCI|nr:cysteine-rich receptor-like protein kinase [Tanacetum cinerariifolium]